MQLNLNLKKMKLKLITLLFISTVLTIQTKAQNSASSIFENAFTQAKLENKNVFVKYSASWCGWCKRMDKQMKSDNCKSFFDSNYVIVTLIVKESEKNKHLEHPGATDFLKKHKGETSGLPFWVVLDDTGNLLEDSFNAKGLNLGCPASKGEVDEFITILKKTSSLTEKNLNIIAKTFLSK